MHLGRSGMLADGWLHRAFTTGENPFGSATPRCLRMPFSASNLPTVLAGRRPSSAEYLDSAPEQPVKRHQHRKRAHVEDWAGLLDALLNAHNRLSICGGAFYTFEVFSTKLPELNRLLEISPASLCYSLRTAAFLARKKAKSATNTGKRNTFLNDSIISRSGKYRPS